MTPKEFARLVARDSYCLHCGATEALAPNHRANRGMGGSKLMNVPSNYALICSSLNGLIESDHRWQQLAIESGWKVSRYADWREIPVWDSMAGVWYLLKDDWTRNVVTERTTI